MTEPNLDPRPGAPKPVPTLGLKRIEHYALNILNSMAAGTNSGLSDGDIDFAIDHIVEAVEHLRSMSPLWDMHLEGVDIKSIEWAEH